MSDLRPYRMLAAGFHNGRRIKAGEIVMLRDDEVADHHELIEEPAPPPRQARERSGHVEAEAETEEADTDEEDKENQPRRGRPRTHHR